MCVSITSTTVSAGAVRRGIAQEGANLALLVVGELEDRIVGHGTRD